MNTPATAWGTRRRTLWITSLVALTLGGWWARSGLVARFPLREDEAIYAYWALHFLYEDPYFLTVWPDKPPLFLWTLAGMLGLVFDAGPGASLSPAALAQYEVVARMVSLGASALTVPIVAQIARRAWGLGAGLLAGLAMAANPFAIAFGPTVYTDSLLVLGGMVALAAAVRGRWLWAGIALGAAIMTKQQGLLYVPLLLGLWGLMAWRRTRADVWGTLARMVAGALAVIGPLVWWDSLRWAVAPSPWDLATRTYGPVQIAALEAWISRAATWGDLFWYLAGSGWTWIAMGVLLGLAMGQTLSTRGRGSAYLFLLLGWSAFFLAAHIVTTVQIWDRYLLPLAPMLALGLGWAGARLAANWKTAARGGLAVGLGLVLLWPAQQAAQGRFPIGADHGDYTGLHESLHWLETHGGDRIILYHQALGWHYRFYLYSALADVDRTATTQAVNLRWFASPVALADNAAKMPWPLKYLIVPDWAPQPALALHLKSRGLAPVEMTRRGRFRVMGIRHLPQTACDWCLCELPRAPRRTLWQLAQPVEPGMMSQP